MAGSCHFSFGSRYGAGQWSFDGSYLHVTPETGAPISLPLNEVCGLTGDGYTISLSLPSAASAADARAMPVAEARATPPGTGATPPSVTAGAAPGPAATTDLVLSRLGAGGPTLLEELRRLWLVARAETMRLGGSGQAKPFYGRVSGLDGASAAPEPFQALLFEDVLVMARDGRDVTPLFLALFGSVEFDDAGYSVRVRQWPGQEVSFSKMAGQTDEFLKGLRANRALLAGESAAILATALPGIPVGGRGALSGMWLPGRLMELEAMEVVCPGFGAAFRDQWLVRVVRRDEGRHLLDWTSGGSAWLGCTREKAEGEGAGGTEQALWLLCGKNGIWFLEALSLEDRATYCFAGGDDLPALVSRLLCAPQFSREALYNPLDELTGGNAGLAIPARFLGFLAALRARFKGRVIHQSFVGWQKEVDRLSKPGA